MKYARRSKQYVSLLVIALALIGIHKLAAQTEPSSNQLTPTLTVAAEKRCGWLENPTPANYWLTDADGEWTISVQGGYQSEDFYDLPASNLEFHDEWAPFSEGRSYGYGCACLDGRFDPDTGYVRQIIAMQPLTLEKCRTDPNLPPEPDR